MCRSGVLGAVLAVLEESILMSPRAGEGDLLLLRLSEEESGEDEADGEGDGAHAEDIWQVS